MKRVNKKILLVLGLVFVETEYVSGMESFNKNLIQENTFYIVGESVNMPLVNVMKNCVHNYFIFAFKDNKDDDKVKKIAFKNNSFTLYQENKADIELPKNHYYVSFITYLLDHYFENNNLIKNALNNNNNYGVFIFIESLPMKPNQEPIDQVTIKEYLKV